MSFSFSGFDRVGPVFDLVGPVFRFFCFSFQTPWISFSLLSLLVFNLLVVPVAIHCIIIIMCIIVAVSHSIISLRLVAVVEKNVIITKRLKKCMEFSALRIVDTFARHLFLNELGIPKQCNERYCILYLKVRLELGNS